MKTVVCRCCPDWSPCLHVQSWCYRSRRDGCLAGIDHAALATVWSVGKPLQLQQCSTHDEFQQDCPLVPAAVWWSSCKAR